MSNTETTTTPKLMVSIAGLHKSYGTHEVLKNADIQVMPGEVIANHW